MDFHHSARCSSQTCVVLGRNVFRYEYLRSRPDTLTIRFEDFIQDPEEILCQACSHLHLPIEKAPGRFAAEWLMHPLGGPTVKANARTVLESRPNAHGELVISGERIFPVDL